MHEDYIKHALKLAQEAEKQGEVPIGAVIVYEDKIIGEGWNQPISSNDPTAHAEIVALRAAAKYLNNYRLTHSILYVTLEPCAMCAAALLHARVKTLVFGAYDSKKVVTTLFSNRTNGLFNHRVEIISGILENECSKKLKDFFEAKREL